MIFVCLFVCFGSCETRSAGVSAGVEAASGLDLDKLERYARQRAAALGAEEAPRYVDTYVEGERSWRGPKLILVHDQLERIAHWATGGDAAATHALLCRLQQCCEAPWSSQPAAGSPSASPSERAQHDEL